MNIVRISTAGSVDDGKSTLIGRLLYDTNSIPKDKLKAIQAASERKGKGELDLSLFTDGLTAEREQGITIDVAHIYFNTSKRKYIIADTPGHVEYTRNMVTGASNSEVSIILIDARKGVLEQTKRHLFITSLLGVKSIVVAINKMDLVDFSEEVFNNIVAEFNTYLAEVNATNTKVKFIPLSSKYGDNVVTKSDRAPWYTGETILEYLENHETVKNEQEKSRFRVQYVIRPQKDEYVDYRAFAGKITDGTFSVGQKVTVLPGGKTSTIKSIEKYTEKFEIGTKGQSLSISLNDEIDVSRGDILVPYNDTPKEQKSFDAQICWVNNTAFNPAQKYLLQHGTRKIVSKITQVKEVIDPKSLKPNADLKDVALNTIATVEFKTASPIFADEFQVSKSNGSFILIDEFTNNTVAVGFVK